MSLKSEGASDHQRKISTTKSSINSDRQTEINNSLSSNTHLPLNSGSNVKVLSVLDSPKSSHSSGSLKHIFPSRGKLPHGSETFRQVLEEIEREKRKQEGLTNLNVNINEKQSPNRSPRHGKRNLGGLWRKSTNTVSLTSKMFRSHHNVSFDGRDK
ncbi:hypothetical protein CHS0354_042216 [Potamilus streckersoni]|uniref:Uncharacterized protein n=1 Tax=Potamilus streckersoni TaxID=2493646 RepID=A0AAE0WHY5_9BIVA|nr:hypothetical protein CHS0354_042216 [Potamilus streckersoni]